LTWNGVIRRTGTGAESTTGAVGYAEGDIPDLVAGTMKQQRLLATSPREVTEEDLAGILTRSLSLW
jgi:alcohol dehydrogenase class IV